MPHPATVCRAVLLAWVLAGSASCAAPPGAAAMKQRIAALPDAAYVQRDDDAVAALPAQAREAGFEGLLLGAPRRVAAADRAGFAALVLSSRSGERERSVPWRANAMLVATDVARGEVLAAPAFARDPSKSPGPEPAAASAPKARAPSAMAGTAWLPVAERLSLPDRTARYALRLVYFDQVSDEGVTDVLSEVPVEGAIARAQAAALVERLLREGQSNGLPAFRAGPQTPALAAPGIAVHVAPLGTQPLALHAAMRIELSRQMLVEAGAAPASAPAVPAAIVRATLLVVHKGHATPFRASVDVPVWSPGPPPAGTAADAPFSIDLATVFPAAALVPGAQLYVLAGRHLSGPHALAR